MFLFFITMFNSLVIPSISLIEYFYNKKHVPKKGKSGKKKSSYGRNFSKKSKIDTSIYEKYKDWKPKPSSYFNILK